MASRSVHTLVSRFVLPFIEFVVPPLCLHCGRRRGEEERGLCANCWRLVMPLGESDPLFLDAYERLCADGLVDGLCCGFVFERGSPIQSLIHGLKYGERPTLGVDLGLCLAPRIQSSCGRRSSAALVPVPLHAAKLRERGYNQSERIAVGISRAMALPVVANLLCRRRQTLSQTTLSLDRRKTNVAGAFALRKRRASPRPDEVLLIDDVITSGSTVRECARVLKESGVVRVVACSVGLAR